MNISHLETIVRNIQYDYRPILLVEDLLADAALVDPLERLIQSGSNDLPRKYQLADYCKFQHLTNYPWFKPNFADYRDNLLIDRQLAHASIRSYLATIRAAYDELFHHNDLCDQLLNLFPHNVDYLDKVKAVWFFAERLSRQLDPSRVLSTGEPSKVQLNWLSYQHLEILLSQLSETTLIGIRDRAIIGLLASTGIDFTELRELNKEDIAADSHVIIHKNGMTNREVPLGWASPLIMKWIRAAGISNGPLFVRMDQRSYFLTNENNGFSRLLPNEIGRILHRNPILVDAEEIEIWPDHLRNFYIYSSLLAKTHWNIILNGLGSSDTLMLWRSLVEIYPSLPIS